MPVAVFTLFFGESIPDRADLTAAEWRNFLDTAIAANLPDGYTVFDASGGWLNPASHATVREHTKVLMTALPDTPDSLTRVQRVRAAYQNAFHQQLVGMTVEHACGDF